MVSRYQIKPQTWLTAVLPMLGKLYVLSLFYLMCVRVACTSEVQTISDVVSSNARPLQQPDDQLTISTPTLTVPMESETTLTRGAWAGGNERSGIAVADYGQEKTIGFAV
jgi:hypothetical protein